MTVSGNTTGLTFGGGGQLISYKTNYVNGNITDGLPSSTITPQ